VERLDKVSAQPLPYPYWHHLNANDCLSPADLTLWPVIPRANSLAAALSRWVSQAQARRAGWYADSGCAGLRSVGVERCLSVYSEVTVNIS
jgi:hypothetical protein